MSRPAAAAVAILLAAALARCAASGGGGNTPEDRCRQQAYEDPAVKDAVERTATTSPAVRVPAMMLRDDLIRRFIQKCLAAQGLAPPGGVEPVRRY